MSYLDELKEFTAKCHLDEGWNCSIRYDGWSACCSVLVGSHPIYLSVHIIFIPTTPSVKKSLVERVRTLQALGSIITFVTNAADAMCLCKTVVNHEFIVLNEKVYMTTKESQDIYHRYTNLEH